MREANCEKNRGVYIYRVKNYSRQEVYYCLGEISAREALKKRLFSSIPFFKEWNFEADRISARNLAQNISLKMACTVLENISKREPLQGWKTECKTCPDALQSLILSK